jgi:TRAP-type C4-dicarboxylate transport system substrate-binding protein
VLTLALLVGVLAAGFSSSSAADKVLNLKLGTLAPNGSSFHQSLQAMGEQWKKLSNGSIRLTIFAGGTQGGEADMVGLMQTSSLDAGLLTAMGLGDIEPGVNGLQSIPMAFRSLEEVDYVNEKLRPLVEQRLLSKGYVVLFWGDTGWVRFFSKTPVIHPNDLRKLKVLSWAGHPAQFDIWKSAGFNPVALDAKDIPQGLFSGTVTAVIVPPVFALFSQLDNQASHMLEINWGPLVGACVVRKKSWDRVPPELREPLLKAAAEAGQKVKGAGRSESDASVAAMVKRGLKVHQLTPEVEAEWRTETEKLYERIRGAIVPEDMFDAAMKLLKEYRASGGAK